MKETLFLRDLADIVLGAVENSNNRRLQKQVCCIGGFNGRVFNPFKMFRQHASGFIRFLMNIAMGMSEADFRKMMSALTDRILQAVDSEECDVINLEHRQR